MNKIFSIDINFFLILLSLFFKISSNNIPNLIENIKINKNKVTITANKQLTKKYLNSDFFVEYDSEIDLSTLDESIVTIPFIAHVISIIWASGLNFEIEFMDTQYYESLKTIKKIFQKMYPKMKWDGELIPKKLINNNIAESNSDTKIALLFSGGVDSTFTSLMHRNIPQLLITIFGNTELKIQDKKIIENRKRKVIHFAKTHNHQNSFINSNFVTFINYKNLSKEFPKIDDWRVKTIEDIGWSGICAPILVQKNIPTIFISSFNSWKVPYPSAANIFIDNNIKFAQKNIILYTPEVTRLSKVRVIKNLYQNNRDLKTDLCVCQAKTLENCCKCKKCLITITELLACNAQNLTDFGFKCTPNKLKKEMAKLLNDHKFAGPNDSFDLFLAKKKIKAKAKRGKQLTEYENWLIEQSLTEKCIFKDEKLTWDEFEQFLNP